MATSKAHAQSRGQPERPRRRRQADYAQAASGTALAACHGLADSQFNLGISPSTVSA
ncbi:MAG: hypothetical protein R3D30_05790 [Hyphomicrobiales bacterium]